MFGGRTIISLCLLLIVALLEKIRIKGTDTLWPLASMDTGKPLTQLTSCGRKWTPSSSTGQPRIRGWLRWLRWGPVIMKRTDDHDEDRWSWRDYDDHHEDWWSWCGPMIMNMILTWSRWGFSDSRRHSSRSGTGWTRQPANPVHGCSTWEKIKMEISKLCQA